MVVADNRAYDYNYEQYLNQEPIKKPSIVHKSKTKRKVKQKTHVMSILFVFCISIIMIARYAIIAEMNFSMNSMEKNYKTALKENTDLNVQLMKTINLDNLETVAVKDLNMQYPDQSQYSYVTVSAAKATNEEVEKDYYGINQVQESKYIASVKDVLNKAVRLLD